MAGTSLLALIDDIAAMLDDISIMTKVATKKTAGVLGDDLALNAQQVTGVVANRELPVVWAVAKGSALNKLILVPSALAISALVPWLIVPLLMLGGAYLCFEGVEKLAHKYLHPEDHADQPHGEAHIKAIAEEVADPDFDPVAVEKEKIKGAVRTDFILSAEIIVIALGTAAHAPLYQQALTLVAVAIIMNVGVYGLVAGIVKLDDLGFYLARKKGPIASFGTLLVKGTPYLMKTLSVVGTAAMFLVGGGILAHGFHALDVWINNLGASAGSIGAAIIPALLHGVLGIIVGALVLAIVEGVKRVAGKTAEDH